jgi:hypothetical protein
MKLHPTVRDCAECVETVGYQGDASAQRLMYANGHGVAIFLNPPKAGKGDWS